MSNAWSIHASYPGTHLVTKGSLAESASDLHIWPPRMCYQMGRQWKANALTGELFQRQCRHRRWCLYHAEREAQQLSLAIDQAHTNYLLTLSLIDEDCTSRLMKSFQDRLKSRCPQIPWVYALERKEEQLAHAHFLVRAPGLDLYQLADVERGLRRRFGSGDLHVLELERGSHPSGYLLKAFKLSNYPDAVTAEAAINRHLDLNSGRMVHSSRNLFMSEWGETVTRKAVLAEVHHRLLRP